MDHLVSEMMRIVEKDVSSEIEDVLLECVKQELIKGASLVPHITFHLMEGFARPDKTRRWLDLGFDPNTQLDVRGKFPRDPPRRGTLLDSTLWSAYTAARGESKTYELVKLLCSRGTRVTSEMCGDHKGDNEIGKRCRMILRAYHPSQILVVLLASRTVVPEIAGVLKGFLV